MNSDMRKNKIINKTSDFTVTDFQQFFLPSLRTSGAGYVGYVSRLTRGIDPMAD